MVSSFMLIVDPALLVKVVMEVVVDSGWMVYPALPRVLVHHPRWIWNICEEVDGPS